MDAQKRRGEYGARDVERLVPIVKQASRASVAVCFPRGRKAFVPPPAIRGAIRSNRRALARRRWAGERQALHEQSERKNEVNEPHVIGPCGDSAEAWVTSPA
ncbi:hypothetical protein DSM21852_14610 [Methylocystis bryophila]|nr:hypothetical protein DSM21852_14610 [Methylocystis bryophila]